MALGYQPDTKITDLLRRHQFTYSAEVIPPRNGASQADILQQIDRLTQAGARFLSVTKGAGGSLRGGSLPIAQLVKEQFKVPCIAHFTCRDLVPEEVENQLMDHHYFGIRNILALRGDPPLNQPNWQPRPESYPYAYQLVEQIRNLNQGQYLERKDFTVKSRTSTDFCIGAAVYPDHPEAKERTEFFRAKVRAGAEYGITQMLFNPDAYARFLDTSAKAGLMIPVLPGARIVKSKGQALRMGSRFQIDVPQSFVDSLPEDDKTATTEQILTPFFKLIEDFKRAGAPGIHLFVLSDTDLCCEVLKNMTS